MPRREMNNPSERILRLLDGFTELEDYVALLEDTLARADLIEGLPARPMCKALIEERTRQSLMRGRNLKARNYMRRVRSASEAAPRAGSFKGLEASPSLTDARKAEIDALIASMDSAPAPEVVLIHTSDTGPAIEPDPDAMQPSDVKGLFK